MLGKGFKVLVNLIPEMAGDLNGGGGRGDYTVIPTPRTHGFPYYSVELTSKGTFSANPKP